MSSITYHFGGKEGLYLACADHIASAIKETLHPAMQHISANISINKEDAIQSTILLTDHMTQLMIAEESLKWANFIIREQQNPGPAFERLYSGAIGEIASLMVQLILVARPDLDDRQARIMGISLFGQSLVLRAAYATVTHILDTATFSMDDQQQLRDRIRRNVDILLRSDQPS